MSHLYINLDVKKISQFLSSLDYCVRMGNRDQGSYYIKRLKEYIDHRVALTAFEKGEEKSTEGMD